MPTKLNSSKYYKVSQANQLNISHLFFTVKCKNCKFKRFSWANLQFDPYIGPYQVLQLRDRVNMGNDGNKGIFCILQICSITGASSSNCYCLIQDNRWRSLTRLQRCSRWGQILEVIPYLTAALLPLTSYLTRHPSKDIPGDTADLKTILSY